MTSLTWVSEARVGGQLTQSEAGRGLGHGLLQLGDLLPGEADVEGQVGVGNLEAAHGRASRFGVVHGLGTQGRLQLVELLLSSGQLAAEAGALGVGDHALRVVGLAGVGVEAVECEVLAGVAEVVLLPPAGEHAMGHGNRAEVGPAGQDGSLMVVAAAGDLTHRQGLGPALASRQAQAGPAVGELVLVGLAVGDQALLGEGTPGLPAHFALAVGEEVEAGLDDLGEELR